MTNKTPLTANEFIELQLDERAKDLEGTLESDVLAIMGEILSGVDSFIRDVVEERHSSSNRDKLTVILTTAGGYIELVQRIVDTLRHHYNIVDFIVPDYALSAGTVLVMSGDTIYMDYYSRLGPIDPQVQSSTGRAVSALGYLKQWERLIESANDGTITLAEVQLMINGFDQADLYHYEQARELSVSLLEEWLVKYKFKNWQTTKTRGIAVTDDLRRERANDIANKLNETERWHVHTRGISIQELRNDLNLIIDDFGESPELSKKIRNYHGLLDDYRSKMGHQGVIHTAGIYKPYVWSE